MKPILRFALQPLAKIFQVAVSVRGVMYSLGVMKSVKVERPVVSIGNITMGGTGKTAIVLELLHWCDQQGIKAGVVSRGYRRQSKGVERVVNIDSAAQIFGDEPTMIAQKFPQVPVYVGALRSAAADTLIRENPGVQLIIADDAFQHRALQRDLDVVLIDATEDLSNYRLLPSGRAREPLTALARAQFVIVTKTNLVAEKQRHAVLQMLAQAKSRMNGTFALVDCKYMATRWLPLTGGEPRPIKKTDRVFLVSGIGNPEAFRHTIAAVAKVVGHSRFADHHDYTLHNFEDILEEFEAASADYILTTEKDAVKLRKFASLHGKFRVALLEPQFSSEIQSLYDKIVRLVR